MLVHTALIPVPVVTLCPKSLVWCQHHPVCTQCGDIYTTTHRSQHDWDTHTQCPLTTVHDEGSGSGHSQQFRQIKVACRNTRQLVVEQVQVPVCKHNVQNTCICLCTSHARSQYSHYCRHHTHINRGIRIVSTGTKTRNWFSIHQYLQQHITLAWKIKRGVVVNATLHTTHSIPLLSFHYKVQDFE